MADIAFPTTLPSCKASMTDLGTFLFELTQVNIALKILTDLTAIPACM